MPTERITKIQRWLDLIAYLAGRRLPVTVEQLMEALPAFRERWRDGDEKDHAAIRRTFERDKAELREAGIPLETVPYTVDGEPTEGYRLRDRDFYLPYVRLVAEAREGAGPGERDAGERGGSGDAFHVRERELSAALAGLRTLIRTPGFPLQREARSAFRKLTFDLGDDLARVGGGEGEAPVLFVEPPGAGEVRERLGVLSDALERRKRVRFRYHGIYRGAATDRSVRPYGLLFQHGHWYLIGQDEDRDAMRVFRVGRMEAVEPNPDAPRTPDYRVPDDFRITDWAGRDPWELGDEDEAPVEARVRFRFPRSLWAERNDVGALEARGDDGSQVRSFRLLQTEPFVRWVLSLDGEAEVEAPPELRDEVREMRRRVAELHAGEPSDPAPRGTAEAKEPGRG